MMQLRRSLEPAARPFSPVGRSLLLLSAVCMLLASVAVACAQDDQTPPGEPAPPGMVAPTPGAQPEEGVPPAEEPTAPVPEPVSLADIIWNPTVDQLSDWITEGITAAGDDLDFLSLPVLGRMTWNSLDGVPLADNRSARFAALMTPELTSYVVGYGAAWDTDTWNAIQEDVEKVSNELATTLASKLDGGPLYFAVAISGPLYADMMSAVYYQGEWHTLDLKPWGAVTDYAPDSAGTPVADPQWATKYLLSQESTQPALQPPSDVRVYLCTWDQDASTDVDSDFLSELPSPEWTAPTKTRLAVGNADLLAWVDFDMVE